MHTVAKFLANPSCSISASLGELIHLQRIEPALTNSERLDWVAGENGGCSTETKKRRRFKQPLENREVLLCRKTQIPSSVSI